MFNRVAIQLGAPDPAREKLPTDARLAAVRKGADDPGLVALHFQFGRYLLMGSSRRPGRLPANLQGIWNDKMWAPWEADYHLNINLQMNYWPAGAANLPETIGPLMDWFELLAQRGQESAKRLYESDGWVAYLATNPFGRVHAQRVHPRIAVSQRLARSAVRRVDGGAVVRLLPVHRRPRVSAAALPGAARRRRVRAGYAGGRAGRQPGHRALHVAGEQLH